MDIPFRFDKSSRRCGVRHDCALAVRWKHGGMRELGYATNLSLVGFCLRTRQLHRPGFDGEFVLSRDAGDVAVHARVVWVRQLQVESHVAAWHEMGLRLEEPVPDGYLTLVQDVESPPVERRQFRRFSHSLVFRIKCAQGTFRARSVDISKNGVLFLSDELPAVDELIEVEMKLPGTAAPVTLQAVVVRRVDDPDEKVRGFAVRFHGLEKGEEQMFINYLKIVKELRSFASSV
jgi:hypothetical protein